jgi:hypothetical protein
MSKNKKRIRMNALQTAIKPPPSVNKSKKIKTKQNGANKTLLWNIFDTEIANENKKEVPLECMYGSSGREMCERCESILAFSDEGFLTCTNSKCGIIYKDLVDQSAEWRYYGADDNQNSDPTRCGMPINPLLQESSYGCKVLCCGSSSYQMRKSVVTQNGLQCPTKKSRNTTSFKLLAPWLIMQAFPK